jgi:hypothetical protein
MKRRKTDGLPSSMTQEAGARKQPQEFNLAAVEI